MRINKTISSAESLGSFDVSDESKVRFVIEDAGPSNTLVIRARLYGQQDYTVLKTIIGATTDVVNVFTYEELQVECTVYDSLTNEITIIAASFNEAGGSAIESIDVPSGDTLTDIASLVFTSSDNSVNIVGDNVAKSIDFTTSASISSYVPVDATDWSPSPDTVAEGLDQLADRTTTIENDLLNKIDVTEKGAPNGVAPLNGVSKIDSIYLPSYVDDIEEYANLAAFPLIGETGKIYVALDTNLIYRWSGSTYIQVSESPVLSVNTKVGAVVLDKTDIGLDQVDNTSDIDKPVSTATQTEIDNRITPFEEESQFQQYYVYENNAAVYADADPGIKDPSAAIRDGWYYENQNAGDKVNWYFFDGTTQGTVTLGDFSAYAVMTFDDIGSAPIIAIYTFPTGSGDAIPGFAHSRVTYDGPLIPAPVAGQKYLLYFKENPPVFPELPRIQLSYAAATSIGDKNPAEIVLTSSFGSNSTEPVGDVKYMVEQLGIYSPTVKQNVELRIRVASQLDLDTHIADTSNPHSVTKEQVGLGNVDNTSDLDKPVSDATQDALDLKVDIAGDTMTGTLTMLDTTIVVDGTITQGYPSTVTVGTNNILLLDTSGVDNKETSISSGVINLTRTNVASSTSDTTMIISTDEGSAYLLANNTDYANDAASQLALNAQSLSISYSDNITGISTNGAYGSDSFIIQTTQPDSSYVAIEGSSAGIAATEYDGISSNPLMPVLPEHYTVKQYVDNLVSSGEAGIVEKFEIMKEPTGFPNRTDSTTSFVDLSREFTIAPVSTSFEVYVKSTKFIKSSAETIAIPNISGNHYIYYNDSGVLSSTQVLNSDLFQNNALVSIVYWNSETSSHVYFAEERHGLTMDGATHTYLHTVFGARYLSGLALQNFSVNGDGNSASHAQFTSDSGSIRDEDLLITIASQSQIPVLYREGQLWRKKAADSFPIIYSGTAGYTGASGRLPFNEYTGGAWQLTEIANNSFVLIHVFGTNDKDNPVVAIQGIATYGNVTAARIAASSEITSLSGLPFAEFVALGSVVFQSADTFANTPKAAISSVNGADYVDFRGTQLYTPAGEATTHSLLSGLSGDDHIQYHTDERGDLRYYTKTQIDADVIKKAGTTAFTGDQSMGGNKLTNLGNPVALTDAVNLQTLNSAIGSSGDIFEKSFSFLNNQSPAADITEFNFANGTVRSFEALVSVTIIATSNLYETFEIKGIQKNSDWFISITSEGDNSQVILSITSSGQMQYTSANYSGFVSGTLKFRAITTSV